MQTREKQQAPGPRMNPGRRPLTLGAGPFVEAIGGNDATPLLKRFAESWPLF